MRVSKSLTHIVENDIVERVRELADNNVSLPQASAHLKSARDVARAM
jgi:hypothetical protein